MEDEHVVSTEAPETANHTTEAPAPETNAVEPVGSVDENALSLPFAEMTDGDLQAVVVREKDIFGEIALERHANFNAVFASGEPTAAIDAVEKDYR